MARQVPQQVSQPVDWRQVDQELYRVPQEFKDPKFYALKHVVDILTADDPRNLVAQLRDQEERLAGLVEGMVQGYHSGFAKSIQNYSQILQLFGDAKDQVAGLKKALADASRQLSAQSRTLQQQWRKSLALESSLKLLDNIQLVVAAPEAIDNALAAKDWSSAVSLLMEACNKLVKDGIAQVGAMRRLKSDIVTISIMLEAQLLQELHSRVFVTTPAAGAAPPAAAAAAAGGGGGGSYSGRGSSGRSSSPSRLGQQQQQQQQGGDKALARMSPAPGSSGSSSMPSYVLDALQADNNSPSSPRGAATAAAAVAQGTSGTVGDLVSCLMLLDALDDANMYLLLHARAGVRQMILRVMEAWIAQQEQGMQFDTAFSSSSSRPGSRFAAGPAGTRSSSSSGFFGAAGVGSPARGRSMGGPMQGASSTKDAWSVAPSVQLSAQQLLTAVFDACLKVLANLGVLLQELLDTSTAGGSSSSSKPKAGGSSSIGSSGLKAGSIGSTSSAGSAGSPRGQHSSGLTRSNAGSGQYTSAALHVLKQQQQPHRRSPSAGGSGDATTAAGAAAGAGAAAAGGSAGVVSPTGVSAAAAAGDSGALDPLVALQSMQSGLLPASSVTFANGIATSLGASVATGGSVLYGPGGLAAGAIQGLEWTKATSRTPIGLLKTQCAHLWQEMQAECLLLLTELLRANLKGVGLSHAGAARQGGWLAEFADLGARTGGQFLAAAAGTAAAAANGSSGAAGGGGSSGAAATAAAAAGPSGGSFSATAASGRSVTGSATTGVSGFSGDGVPRFTNSSGSSNLTFKFDLAVSDAAADGAPATAAAIAGGPSGATAVAAVAAAAGGALTGGGAAAAAEGGCYARLLKQCLGQQAGGPYLTPTVYLAVNQFVDDALVIIHDACAMPPPTAAAAADGSSAAAQAAATADPQNLDARLRSVWLRQSVADYVLEGFLPQLWVDLRGRCTAALEDADAFKPQAVGAAGLTAFMACSASPGAAAAAVAGASAAGSSAGGSSGPPRIRPPQSAVPAAGFAAQVLLEVMAWMPAIPPNAAATLTGILGAILTRVLEALAGQVQQCIAGSKAGSLALRPAVALVMGTEPDATLLSQEDASVFYVPAAAAAAGGRGAEVSTEAVLRLWGQAGAFDDYGSFLTSLKSADKPQLVPGHHRAPVQVRGLGLEGESAAEEVLLLCNRERPSSTQQLLAGNKARALVLLAALAESADWLADCLAHMAAHTAPGGSLAPGSWLSRHTSSSSTSSTSSTSSSSSSSGHKHGHKGGGPSHLGPKRTAAPGGGLPRAGGGAGAAGAAADVPLSIALLALSKRYRSLAGSCCRVLRLDLLLLVGHQLHALSGLSHTCEEEDVTEVPPCIGSLSRVASRAAEELSPHLGPRKLSYICGAVAVAAARVMMWVLQEIPEINPLGVERMIHGLALLQGSLGTLGTSPSGGAAAAAPSADVVRAYDRAKSYFTLVGLPAAEVVHLASERPGRYSVAEWEALLQVKVPGRVCDHTDMAALLRALDKHYHFSAGQKVVEFFEDVRQTVQVPVQTFTGGVSAGFKGGLVQARALLKKTADAVSDAAAATATSVSAAAAKARSVGGGGGGGSAAAGSTGGSRSGAGGAKEEDPDGLM